MERQLVQSKAFEKAYKKFTARNAALKISIAKALRLLQADAFDPMLRTHKLSGKLVSYLACSCGYDCRIVFELEKSHDGATEIVFLVDIGTHDDVY